MGTGTMEKQKQSLYFPEEVLREVMAESVRLDRSLSWTVQQAWRIARGELRKFPTADHERPDRALPADREGAPARPSAQVLDFLAGKFDHDPSR
jgi:uncharacterized small protein (TIGR04563 family)